MQLLLTKQHLDLHDCREVFCNAIKQTNDNKWHIPVMIPPRAITESEEDILEADSDCSSSEDDEYFAAKIR